MLRAWCFGLTWLLASTGLAMQSVPRTTPTVSCGFALAYVGGCLTPISSEDLQRAIGVLAEHLEETLNDPALAPDSWAYFYSSRALADSILESLADLENAGDSHYSPRQAGRTFLHDLAAALFPEPEDDMSPAAVRRRAVEKYFGQLASKVAAAAKTLQSTASPHTMKRLNDLKVLTLHRLERGMNSSHLMQLMAELSELLPTEGDDCWRIRDFYSRGYDAWGKDTFQPEEVQQWVSKIIGHLPVEVLEARLRAAGCSSENVIQALVEKAPDLAELVIQTRWPR